MTRRLPLMILTGFNFLMALSITTTHRTSPAMQIWEQYLPHEGLVALFLFAGIIALQWMMKRGALSERRLITSFVCSMVGMTAYTVLLFSFAVVENTWNGFLLAIALYAVVVYNFAEGQLG